MPNRVALTLEPGLASLLDADQPVSNSALEPALDAFLTTEGVAQTPVHETLDATIRRHAETTGETAGWWTALKQWWNGEEHRVVGSEQVPVVVASYWLTLPEVPQAKVALTSTVANATEATASLTIAGIGGGPTVKAELKDSVAFDAVKTERAVLTRMGTFEKITVIRGGRVVATYPRLVALDDTVMDWSRLQATVPDPATLGTPLSTENFWFADASGPSTKTLTVSRGTSWELGLDLKLAKLGLEFKVGMTITYNRDVDYKYELPAGHGYTAQRYLAFPANLWTVSAPSQTS